MSRQVRHGGLTRERHAWEEATSLQNGRRPSLTITEINKTGRRTATSLLPRKVEERIYKRIGSLGYQKEKNFV